MISLKIDWFDLLAVQGTLRSLFQYHSLKVLCLLYSPTLTTLCDHWEDYSLDYTDICQQSNVSAFQHKIKSLKFKNKDKRSALVYKKGYHGDFPGGPTVKTLPSNAEGAGLIPDWGDKIPHASRPKTDQNRTEAILSQIQ